MLAHLRRAGRAVEADHVDAERLERRERRADLAAHEHRAGRLDRHLDEDRQADARLDDRLLAAVDGRLGLQDVLRGLDEQRVGAAEDEPAGLESERRLEVGVCGVPEARQLRAGSHGAEHPAHPVIAGLEVLGDPPRDLRAGARELLDAILDAVVGEVRPVGAEGVRLDRVDARLEVGAVDRLEDVGAADVEDLVAALVLLEVLEGRVELLQHRAHRAVGDHDALLEGRQERLGTLRPRDRRDVERGHRGRHGLCEACGHPPSVCGYRAG